MKEDIKVGDRVITVSNEPDDELLVGKVAKLFQERIPVVEDEETGEQFLCCGITRQYSEELFQELDGMPTIEQWNYLAPNRCQISEKYGVKYKTYPKEEEDE